ncbi:MAG TPA: hypothetical protein VMW08_04465 [Acidimicrobiales bacterium]|nr:hypothetical protein [Acidimicrobiales bacterium]
MLSTAEPESEVNVTGAPNDAGGAGEALVIVEDYIPGRGVEAFQQAQVGLDLAPGWSLRDFTLNDVAIPDEELDISRELDRYVFSPGDGKTIEALDPQTNCASAVVFQFSAGSDSATRTERWCFEVL